jgi:hypothetical protein
MGVEFRARLEVEVDGPVRESVLAEMIAVAVPVPVVAAVVVVFFVEVAADHEDIPTRVHKEKQAVV